jgi:DNA-binding MarR family transcriptional regulator
LDVKQLTTTPKRRAGMRQRRPPAARPAPQGGAAEPARIDLGLLPELVGYHVRLAQMAIFADFEATLGALALSPGLFGLLVIVEANPGLKQTQLASAARLDRSTLVPALDRLEDRGLVERRAAPADRRSNGLFLTAAGAALLADAKRAVLLHECRLAGGFEPGERDRLVALLAQVFPGRR